MSSRALVPLCVSLVAIAGCRTGAVESVDVPAPSPAVVTTGYVPNGTALEVELRRRSAPGIPGWGSPSPRRSSNRSSRATEP
jgi:hypothetical protein